MTLLPSFLTLPDAGLGCHPLLALIGQPLFAEIQSNHLIAIVAIIGGLLIAAIGIIYGSKHSQRREELWHETARVALEKGQPLPPMPRSDDELGQTPPPGVSFAEWQAVRRAESRSNQIKGGFVLIAVGIALWLFLGLLIGRAMGMVGAIPGFIGIALLLHALFETLFAKPAPRSRPPQS